MGLNPCNPRNPQNPRFKVFCEDFRPRRWLAWTDLNKVLLRRAELVTY